MYRFQTLLSNPSCAATSGDYVSLDDDHHTGQYDGYIDGRGLPPFTSQLKSSVFFGKGGARRDCVARVKGVLGGVYGV
jgi:hypothetical protein